MDSLSDRELDELHRVYAADLATVALPGDRDRLLDMLDVIEAEQTRRALQRAAL